MNCLLARRSHIFSVSISESDSDEEASSTDSHGIEVIKEQKKPGSVEVHRCDGPYVIGEQI